MRPAARNSTTQFLLRTRLAREDRSDAPRREGVRITVIAKPVLDDEAAAIRVEQPFDPIHVGPVQSEMSGADVFEHQRALADHRRVHSIEQRFRRAAGFGAPLRRWSASATIEMF